uniref:NYN domain-containing protein n=1 Tax=Noccaea caerulescens TaxID=107243 RepID=A0A1J3CQY4_NOCCA
MEPSHYVSYTLVLWDVNDFPVPQDHHVKMFDSIVRKAVASKAYRDVIDIQGYCEKLTEEEEFDFCNARIRFYFAEKSYRLQRMLMDMLIFARKFRGPGDVNIIIVAKDIPNVNTELFSVMETLRRRGCKVFFVVPDGAPESDFPPRNSANFVWRWTSLFKGDSPTVVINTDQVGTSQVPQKRQKTRKGVSRVLAKSVGNPAWINRM